MKKNDEFLDLKVNESIVKYREAYEDDYKIISEFIELLRRLEKQFIDNENSNQNIYLSAAIVQLNKLVQSAILLYERGLPESGNIIVRTIIELSLNIINVINDETNLHKMDLEQWYEELGYLNYIKKNNEDPEVKKYLDGLILEIKNYIGNNKRIKLNKKDIAEKNGLNSLYGIYKIYCTYTHFSTIAVGEIIKQVNRGYVINGNFRMEGFSMNICLLISIASVPVLYLCDDYFKNPMISKVFSEFCEQFLKMYGIDLNTEYKGK